MKYLNTVQAAKYLSVSKHAILSAVRRGEIIPAVIGRGYNFSSDDLDLFFRFKSNKKKVR